MSGAVLLAVNDFPPLLGGEAALYHALARRLPPRDTLVLAPRLAGDAAVDAALEVPVLRRWLPAYGGTLRRALRTLVAGLHLARLCGSARPRYILCGQLLSLGVPTRIVAGLRRAPYAVFVHGADLADFCGRPVALRLLRFIVRGADAVIANSRFTAGLVERTLPGAARRIVVLPMGVDPAPDPQPGECERLRRRYRLGPGPVLLSVARLVPVKGHDVVIDALPQLLAIAPDLTYLVVGDGPERAALERRARARGVRARVRFAGSVAPAELSAHYRLGTLFVLLSRDRGGASGLEGFGLAFLEAASHGLPIIAGRSGGAPEAVGGGEAGILVPPDSAGDFAAAAARLLLDAGLRERMAEAARRFAAAHSWDHSARVLRALVPGW